MVKALLNKGIILLQQGDTSQAQKSFFEVAESCKEQKSVNAQLNRIIPLSGLGEYEEALKLLKQLAGKIRLAPEKKRGFLSDLESLASAQQTLDGIKTFLAQVRNILEGGNET